MNITAPNYYLQRVINLDDVLVYKEPSMGLKLELDTYSEYNSYIKLPTFIISNFQENKMIYFKTNITKFLYKDYGGFINGNLNKLILAQTGAFFITIESYSDWSYICEYDIKNKLQWRNQISKGSLPKEMLFELNNKTRNIKIFNALNGEFIYEVTLWATTYTGNMGFGLGHYGKSYSSSSKVYCTPFVWETDIGKGGQVVDVTKAKLGMKIAEDKNVTLLDVGCVVDNYKIDISKAVELQPGQPKILTEECLK